MKNIRIEVRDENYIVVIADSKRFGNDEVMFEGNTFDQCFDYVKKATGKAVVDLKSSFLYEAYKDRNGRSFPVWMEVIA